jgi:hypothetical protein
LRSALVILFNQDYSKNIPKLERIYQGRFSHVVYLVPDYWSRLHQAYTTSPFPIGAVALLDRAFHITRRLLGRSNPHELDAKEQRALGVRFRRVIGHQFFFYDFVRQAADYLLSLGVDWYWVVGDDAILNPALDEESLPQAVGMQRGTDAVICRPVISSDAWLSRIAGSVGSARTRLESVVGLVSSITGKLRIEPEDGAVENKDVAVACADFFGLRHGAFVRILPYWHACFRRRLYVELALPSSLLAVSESPVALDNFLWTRLGNIELGLGLLDKFQGREAPVFVHPVKLSVISGQHLSGLFAR